MEYSEKIEHAKDLIREHLDEYNNVKLACSWGKDSMVLLHLALQVNPNIDVFTVLTKFKPKETFAYANYIKEIWNIKLTKYSNEIISMMGSDFNIPDDFPLKFPDACCHLLKVVPTKQALEGCDCWITGLRNTEGKTRVDYKEIEQSEDIVKLNPILTFTESEIWRYMEENNIPIHPWYLKEFPHGKRIRSIGCAPCTKPILPNQEEREGRWSGTSKCGGECGIHTMDKKNGGE